MKLVLFLIASSLLSLLHLASSINLRPPTTMLSAMRSNADTLGTRMSWHASNMMRRSRRGCEMVGSRRKELPCLRAWSLPSAAMMKVGLTCAVASLLPFTIYRRWMSIQAGRKFRERAALYMTIPLISGILNWATNRLAVWMIFNPQEFYGIPFISRKIEGQPLGWFGWQGIVPAKVTKMSSDIVDITTEQLLDVKKIFGRIEENRLLDHLRQGNLFAAVLNSAKASEVLPSSLIREGEAKVAGGGATLTSHLLEHKTERIVMRVIRALKKDPLKFCPLKSAVVDDMTRNKMLLCELFQRCGRQELKFLVFMGLWGGAALGIVQMMMWVLWDPKWSLAVGGAVVGYVTNWAAIKLMFEPVAPWRGPPMLEAPLELVENLLRVPEEKKWKGVQGLFLRRQNAVSEEFSSFMAEKILSPEKLWRAILLGVSEGPDCNYQAPENLAFDALLQKVIKEEVGVFLVGGEERMQKFTQALRQSLMLVVPYTSSYLSEQLDLKSELRRAMKAMDTRHFERVLHPIFEEDEMTLILVGGLLGGAAGYAQTAFY